MRFILSCPSADLNRSVKCRRCGVKPRRQGTRGEENNGRKKLSENQPQPNRRRGISHGFHGRTEYASNTDKDEDFGCPVLSVKSGQSAVEKLLVKTRNGMIAAQEAQEQRSRRGPQADACLPTGGFGPCFSESTHRNMPPPFCLHRYATLPDFQARPLGTFAAGGSCFGGGRVVGWCAGCRGSGGSWWMKQ